MISSLCLSILLPLSLCPPPSVLLSLSSSLCPPPSVPCPCVLLPLSSSLCLPVLLSLVLFPVSSSLCPPLSGPCVLLPVSSSLCPPPSVLLPMSPRPLSFVVFEYCTNQAVKKRLQCDGTSSTFSREDQNQIKVGCQTNTGQKDNGRTVSPAASCERRPGEAE